MPRPHGCRATGYRAERRLREGVACAVLVAATLALGGCGSVGLGVGGGADLLAPTTTGSLAPARAPTLGLERGALARANAALAEALDPLGPGAPVAWIDPESGASGAIVAAAGPTVEGDLVCRRFRAETAPRDRPATRHVGHACRVAAGTWRIEAAAAAPLDDAEGLPADLMPDLPG